MACLGFLPNSMWDVRWEKTKQDEQWSVAGRWWVCKDPLKCCLYMSDLNKRLRNIYNIYDHLEKNDKMLELIPNNLSLFTNTFLIRLPAWHLPGSSWMLLSWAGGGKATCGGVAGVESCFSWNVQGETCPLKSFNPVDIAHWCTESISGECKAVLSLELLDAEAVIRKADIWDSN